jgi:hypothetical protein
LWTQIGEIVGELAIKAADTIEKSLPTPAPGFYNCSPTAKQQEDFLRHHISLSEKIKIPQGPALRIGKGKATPPASHPSERSAMIYYSSRPLAAILERIAFYFGDDLLHEEECGLFYERFTTNRAICLAASLVCYWVLFLS